MTVSGFKIGASMSHTLLVDIWKSLRRPFILPEQSIRLHKCEYETIDMGVLGCCICSTIHICDFSMCQDVIDTNDGKVCCLSGIVVYPKKYAENEYMDTTLHCKASKKVKSNVSSTTIVHANCIKKNKIFVARQNTNSHD